MQTLGLCTSKVVTKAGTAREQLEALEQATCLLILVHEQQTLHDNGHMLSRYVRVRLVTQHDQNSVTALLIQFA